MSYRRLNANILKYKQKVVPEVSWKPVILTDSKGRYVRQVKNSGYEIEQKILWLGRAGFNSSDAVRFLTAEKINSLLKYHKRICLFIFIGACDFTYKRKRQIHLRKPVCNTLQVYYDNLLYIKRRCAGSRIRLTFLHIPYYSIRIRNKIKGHGNADVFREDDKELSRIIDAVNSRTDDLNSDMTTYSPRLNADLV